MRLRALVLFLGALVTAGAGCGASAGGKIMAETKLPTKEDPNAVLVPYLAPDISEITGIDEDDDEDKDEGDAIAPPAAEPKK